MSNKMLNVYSHLHWKVKSLLQSSKRKVMKSLQLRTCYSWWFVSSMQTQC